MRKNSNPTVATDRVLAEVLAERVRQDARWGQQDHPLGTGQGAALLGRPFAALAQMMKHHCDKAVERGESTMAAILLEEVLEALAETDPVKVREELVQTAAVAVMIVESIDRAAARKAGPDPDASIGGGLSVPKHPYNGADRLHGICRCGQDKDAPVHRVGGGS